MAIRVMLGTSTRKCPCRIAYTFLRRYSFDSSNSGVKKQRARTDPAVAQFRMPGYQSPRVSYCSSRDRSRSAGSVSSALSLPSLGSLLGSPELALLISSVTILMSISPVPSTYSNNADPPPYPHAVMLTKFYCPHPQVVPSLKAVLTAATGSVRTAAYILCVHR